MKRILFSALLMLCPAGVFSQAPGKPFQLYVGGGLTLPVSPKQELKDIYKTGIHGFGAIGFKVNPLIQALFKLEYHSLSRDWTASGVPGGSGATLQAVFAGVDGRLGIPLPASPTQPFGFAGIGVAAISYSEVGGVTGAFIIPEDQSKFYYNIGGGLEFGTGPSVKLFLQVSYLSVASSGEATVFVPITLGVKF